MHSTDSDHGTTWTGGTSGDARGHCDLAAPIPRLDAAAASLQRTITSLDEWFAGAGCDPADPELYDDLHTAASCAEEMVSLERAHGWEYGELADDAGHLCHVARVLGWDELEELCERYGKIALLHGQKPEAIFWRSPGHAAGVSNADFL